MKPMMVVVSMEEEWSTLKSLLQESYIDEGQQPSFSSTGSVEVCDLIVDSRSVSFHCAVLKQDMAEECVSQELDSCFKSCRQGVSTFLLLIQNGRYTKRERRLMEIMQARYGPEVLKFLIVLSMETEAVVDMLDDALLELINLSDGRYCRLTTTTLGSSDMLLPLLEMFDFMLAENGMSGYTENMHSEAKSRYTADTSMKILTLKLQEAEEKEQAFKELVQKREEDRLREMQQLKAKHAESRQREAEEMRKYETKRESLEEAATSHGAMLQMQMNVTNNDNTKKTSILFVGLSGSGKTSAINLISETVGNQYTINEGFPEVPSSTVTCQRKVVLAEGRRIVLVDTPELWDEDGAENFDQVKDCLAMSLPGPHVFLLTLPVGRFTLGDSEMLSHLQKIFGRGFTEHAIILFTHYNDKQQQKVQSVNDYVAGAHPSLQDLVRKCGSRYYALNVWRNTRNTLSYPQVKDLLSGVHKLVASHGGGPYVTKRFPVEQLKERKRVIEERLM